MSLCRGCPAEVATTHPKLSRFRQRARTKAWYLQCDGGPGFPATTRDESRGGPDILEETQPALRFRGCAETPRNQSWGRRLAHPIIFRRLLPLCVSCLSLLVPGRAGRREGDLADSCPPGRSGTSCSWSEPLAPDL